MSTEFMEVTDVLELVQETEAVTETVENIIYQCEQCGTIAELLEDILNYLNAFNGLLIRFSQVLEFFLAFMVIVVFCAVCYSFLKNFTRF